MTSTQLRTVPTRTEGTPRPRRPRTNRLGILIALAVAVLVALTAVVLGWNLDAPPADPPTPIPSGPPRAYLPGGSVHEQQVPEFQHWALVYGPEGSVYKAQVPHGR